MQGDTEASRNDGDWGSRAPPGLSEGPRWGGNARGHERRCGQGAGPAGAQPEPSRTLIGWRMARDPRRPFIGQEAAAWSWSGGPGLGRGNEAQQRRRSPSARVRRGPPAGQVRQVPAGGRSRRHPPVGTSAGGAGRSARADIHAAAMELASSTILRLGSRGLPTGAPRGASPCDPHAGPGVPPGWLLHPPSTPRAPGQCTGSTRGDRVGTKDPRRCGGLRGPHR